MISVEGLTFDYPGLRALDDVSFSIEPRSITALVGPNGSGKTTLLRTIAALATPAMGRVVVDGLDVHQSPREAHRRMGFLSDFYGLYDDLAVRQCLFYRAAAQGVPGAEIEPLVADVAQRLAIADRMQQKAGTLSRGLRQRLAIAQAIVHRPQVVLLDEPASGLDPEARAGLAGVLRDLSEAGMTLMVSSHILAELEDYSTHLLILGEGRVVEHRAIAGIGKGERMILRLARAEPRLGALLGARAGVTDLETDGATARFRLANPVTRHELLRDLVRAGLEVEAFDLERESLQDAYLARMRKERAD
jgi:ABC-2 type transport system ATP-binding protein